MQDKIKIVVHSGHFHTDDVFAVATLMLVLDGKEIEILRSRDKDVIEKGDYVVDVGGVYDADKNLFDHHQVGGAGTRDNGVPYASFGLVWKKYGEQISGSKEVSDSIDSSLVQFIDCIDNGVQVSKPVQESVQLYDITDVFEAFNPSWTEDANGDEAFIDMANMAKRVIKREVVRNQGKIKAKNIVEELYANTPDKRLIVLDKYCPYNETLKKYTEPLLVVFPGIQENDWRAMFVRDNKEDFVYRKYFPSEWGGKNDKELEVICGVEGATFCHRSCHLAGAKTKKAIIEMAQIALDN
ncbi:MAG: MYG1 family protein [Patescibacteria group bacterium]